MEELKNKIWQVIPAEHYVYFIQAEGGGPIKIGYSNNPKVRISRLQTASPQKFLLLDYALFETEELGRKFERLLHERYAVHRLQGEWFDVTMTMIERDLEWADQVSELRGSAYQENKDNYLLEYKRALLLFCTNGESWLGYAEDLMKAISSGSDISAHSEFSFLLICVGLGCEPATLFDRVARNWGMMKAEDFELDELSLRTMNDIKRKLEECAWNQKNFVDAIYELKLIHRSQRLESNTILKVEQEQNKTTIS